jgi:hypothetical protein
MNFTRALSLCFTLFVSAATLVGCGDPSDVGGAAITVNPLDRAWSLEAVGAWRLPVSIGLSADTSRQISEGNLVLRPDFTWELRYAYEDLGPRQDVSGTQVSTGTYSTRPDAPGEVVLQSAGSNAVTVATLRDDGSVDLPLGGLRYHFVAAQ